MDQSVKDWRDLQTLVCQIYDEMGCEAEVEKDIHTVRGVTNIDVYVKDIFQPQPLIYLCECKHWATRVPKAIVHAFRTTVSDIGAHCGFIISKKGFQSGAYEAARNTNVHLVSWEEFQCLHEERWTDATYSRLKDYIRTLGIYITNPGHGAEAPKTRDDWLEWEIENFFWPWSYDLYLQWFEVFAECQNFLGGYWVLPKIYTGPYPFRLIDHPDSKHLFRSKMVKINSKREYFEFMSTRLQYWLERFRGLLGPVKADAKPEDYWLMMGDETSAFIERQRLKNPARIKQLR